MRLDIVDETLRIELSWVEQLLAFTLRNPIEVPLAHITRASTEAPPTSWLELRIPGTFFPGLIKAGTYYTRRGKEFWWWRRGGGGFLVLELVNEPYRRIVLSIPENMQWAEKLARR